MIDRLSRANLPVSADLAVVQYDLFLSLVYMNIVAVCQMNTHTEERRLRSVDDWFVPANRLLGCSVRSVIDLYLIRGIVQINVKLFHFAISNLRFHGQML